MVALRKCTNTTTQRRVRYLCIEEPGPSPTQPSLTTAGITWSGYEYLVNYANTTIISSCGSRAPLPRSYSREDPEASHFHLVLQRWESKSQLGYPLTHEIKIHTFGDGSNFLDYEFQKTMILIKPLTNKE